MSNSRSSKPQQEPNSSAKSWRDVVPIHPAAELFPPMPPDELEELAEDIKKRGLLTPIGFWRLGPRKGKDSNKLLLLDGRNRLDALERAGLLELDNDGWPCLKNQFRIYLEADVRDGGQNPYELVISLNIRRRHLTFNERIDLLDRIIKADPKISSRRAAKLVHVSPTTGTKRKAALEASGDVSTVDTSIDTLGRQLPAKRRGKTKEPPTPNVANVPEDQFEQQVESDKPPTVQALAKQGVKASGRAAGDDGDIPDPQSEELVEEEPTISDEDEDEDEADQAAAGQEPLRCSFCAKSEVKALIKGPNEVYICDECTDLCVNIVAEKRAQIESAPTPISGNTRPSQVESGRRTSEPSAAESAAPTAGQIDRDAKALAAWQALTPEMLADLHAKRDALAAKLTDDQYDIVESLWTLHQLLLHGELNEKNLSAIIEVQPSFDSLGLIDLGKAIGDLGRAWKSQERRAQQDKPAQKSAAPSADDLDGVPSFLDRRPGADANGNRITNGSTS
jgi:hypothetical protein